MPIAFMKPVFLLFWVLVPGIWLLINRSHLKNRNRRRRILIGGLRTGLILVVGLALSDPRIRKGSDRVNLFFCEDVSESVRGRKDSADPRKEGESKITRFMRRAATGIGEEDLAGLIVFGEEPSLEIALKRDFDPAPIRSHVDAHFTNIYEALQLAIGKLPTEGKNRIILFSDGNQNMEDAVEMAYVARALGIEIYPVPLDSRLDENEVLTENIITPPTVPLETPFNIGIVVRSRKETQADLILMRNGNPINSQVVTLKAGKNVFRFVDSINERGLYLYKAIVNAPEDSFPQNNEGFSFTQGTRKSEILYLAGESGRTGFLTQALLLQGIKVEQKKVEDLQPSIHGFLDYSAIILDNVSGQVLPIGVMGSIERYVKDMGGGLIMIGGDKSFGAGRYLKTPVEKALPVFMDVPTALELPGLCLILVIDKSHSMSGDITSKKKLEGAKLAAFSTVEMLNPMDRVGILAFDTKFQWVVPITEAKERRKIANHLSILEADGGTDLYPALEETFKVLNGVSAAKKHVIVLSDGLTTQADFHTLIRDLKSAQITVSTVALGKDSDRSLLKSIAQWGGGRSYYTDNAANLPRIFVGETDMATRTAILERAIKPFGALEGEILEGIPMDDLPMIQGLVITYPKPGARILIDTEEGPLLAAWTYGLGRSVAFTSDFTGRWGKDWIQWNYFGTFIAQMVKWAQRKESPRDITVQISDKEGGGTFTIDVTDDQNRFVNNLKLKLKVLFPSKTDQSIDLDQVAPGRYNGSFAAKEKGAYYLSLFNNEGNGFFPTQNFGFAVAYSEEFKEVEVDYALLQRLASITKGRMIDLSDDPVDLFKTDLNKAPSGKKDFGRPLWPYLVLISLLLLITDVGVRKFQTLGRI
jgi:Ca-activated chloride channel family protein